MHCLMSNSQEHLRLNNIILFTDDMTTLSLSKKRHER